jgi:hypothetical protein
MMCGSTIKSNMNIPSETKLQTLLRAFSTSIPDTVANSSVAIVAANNPVIRHFGSGTLLSVADRHFVVTAGHVIRKASDAQSTVGITGGLENFFIATAGKWILSAQTQNDTDGDPFDIAIYQLGQSQIEKLGERTFLRIGDVSFISDLSHGFFVVSGFPSIWSTESSGAHEKMNLRLLQYSTYSYNRSTAALSGYDSRYHLLLEAKAERAVDTTGVAINFTTLSGHAAQMPQDLQGISGCSVWMIGDLTVPCSHWRADQARLVAVETGVFPGRAAIKATRWNAVTTLLYLVFPDLRSTLDLYADQPS